ncbi:MAG: DUF4157 domain-containing protein [Candidatus Methanoperedens sp.]
MGDVIKTSAKKPEAKRENSVSRSRQAGFSQSTNSPVEQILFLQRTIGNQAVGRLIISGALQAKLKIGLPGDKYEQEADRVAEQVMREEKEKILQAKEASDKIPEVTPKAENNISAIRGGGQPLPESIRSFMEPRFNTDLSTVRIHTDSHAHDLARSINAKAFTVGGDIVLGAGHYAPETGSGKRLMAHELTHVMQQGGRTISGPEMISDLSDPISSWNILEPVVQRQEVEFDLEVPTSEERERLRQRGIQLPSVSSQAADPRGHSDFVDRRLNAVGFGIYLGGYVLYLDGLDIPVFVPESHFNFAATNMAPADLAIFPDHNAALAHIPMGPQAPGQPIPYTYYRGAGGAIIAPTLFTPVTTPRVIQTALQARRQLAEYVQEQLMAVAISIVGGMIIRGIIGWLARIGGGRGTPPPSRLSPAATRARDLARQTRAQGKPVIANMGGAGAPHEPPGAININNQAVGRRGIPNHIEADASDIGQLFDAGSIDQVVGHHMPPSVINWQRAIPGIRNALRQGGTFRFDWRGATSEAAQVVRLLQEAGFREVNNIADTLVTAVRP